jgi:hypothetical protein
MKRILIFTLLLTFTMSAFSQVTEFSIHKSGKTKTLSVSDGLYFDIDITGDSLDYGSINISGEIESLTEDAITLQLMTYEKRGGIGGNTFDIRKYYYDNPGDPVQIDPKTITSIYYHSSGASAVSSVSAGLSAAGYLTALIIAPLISINYKTGDFNSDRYYKVAGAGLITVGVTLPLALIFSGRTFELKDLFENDEYDDGWQFDYSGDDYDYQSKWK